MKVNNTTEVFFRLYESDSPFDLNEYHQTFPEIFKTYFNGYCKKTAEKLIAAMERYSDDYNRFKKVIDLLPDVIEKVANKGRSYFGFSLDVPVHVFVGLYASNAFVDHRTEIYFAIEKLLPDPDLLEIIIAHEMIHSYHYHLLGLAGIDWQAVDWSDVRNSIYLEGVATHLSRKLAPGHPQGVYFSYDRGGEEWLSFCQNHRLEIAEAFLADLENPLIDMEREWLRLSGGQRFGHNRLGYFLGSLFVLDLYKELTESEVLTLLAKGRVSKEVDCWLQRLVGNKAI